MSPSASKLMNAASVHLRSSKIPSQLAKSSSALFSAYGGTPQTLPDLPYDYNALEPAISAETMTLHHTKHHATYVNNINAALEKLDAALSSGDVSGIIALQGAIKFNGGGHLNHALFWENLTSEATCPKGDIEKAIGDCFGDFDAMKSELSAKTIAVQGRYVSVSLCFVPYRRKRDVIDNLNISAMSRTSPTLTCWLFCICSAGRLLCILHSFLNCLQRMGLARVQQVDRSHRSGDVPEPRPARGDDGTGPSARDRCLGTRLLRRLPERPPGLRQSHIRRH